MWRLFFKFLFLTLHIAGSRAMMMRNDALISKMVSDFQKDNTIAAATPRTEQEPQPKNVLSLMQNVLCKNFPTIPCDMIVEDETLKRLIERSIQQLKYKKMSMEKTTPLPGYHLTLFPTINSEDLSNFLQVSETGYYSKNKPDKSRLRKHKRRLAKNLEPLEKETKKKSKGKKESSQTTLYTGRKKIRKFYPHKIKYKDKKERKDFTDYSEEKLSMSVEVPDMGGNSVVRKRMNYKVEPDDPPVWRIDYLKHGDPSLTMFNGYETDRLKEKLVKTGPNVLVSDNILEQASRKDVLHPDVYIKKNFVRKKTVELNSGGLD